MTKARIIADYAGTGATTDLATQAELNTVSTVASAALPKAGGTMTGTIASFTSTGIDDNANALAMTIDSSENVGIGSIPKTWDASASVLGLGDYCTLAGGTGAVYLANNVYQNSGYKYINTNEAAMIQFGGAGQISFRTAASGSADSAITFFDAMSISNNGAVGINTTAPAKILHVVEDSGNVLIAEFENSHPSLPYGVKINFSGGAPDDDTRYFLRGSDSSATRFSVYANGNVNTSDSGTLSSDRRLKHSIVDATSKLDDIMKIKVRNFEWNADYHPAQVGKKMIGFIADEIEEIFPSLVTEHDIAPDPKKITDENGKDITPDHVPVMRKTIKQAFTPIIIKAIQELSAKVTALENA